MRFLPLRQQLLFAQEIEHAQQQPARPAPTRPARQKARPVVRTNNPTRPQVAAPQTPVAAADGELSTIHTQIRTERRLRSLFELVGAGIMTALFLAVAIFA